MFGSLKNSVKNITTAILEKVSPRRQEPETDDGGRQHLGHKNREGFVGLKRPRPRESILLEDDPLDVLVTPPEKRLKHLNEGSSMQSVRNEENRSRMQNVAAEKTSSKVSERRDPTYRGIRTGSGGRDYPSVSGEHAVDSHDKGSSRLSVKPRPALHGKYVDVDRYQPIRPSSQNEGSLDTTKPDVLIQSFIEHSSKGYWRSARPGEHDKCVSTTSDKKTAFKKERVNTVFSFDRKYSDCRRREKRETTADNVVRLAERERYKQLLAQYTSVSLPDYTSSIRGDSSDVETIRSSYLTDKRDKHDSTAKDCLSRTDAIISSFSSSLQQASTPLYSDLMIQARPSSRPYKAKAVASPVKTRSSSRKEHENSVINLGISEDSRKVFTGTDKLNTTRTEKVQERTHDLIDSEWTKKWRNLLDPIELERQRQIDVEERRLKEVKEQNEKQTEDLLKRIDRKIYGEEEEEEEEEAADSIPLTEEMEKRIKFALARGNPSECLVDAFNASITRHDIATLANLNWLNDEVVNFYFNLLKDRSNEPDRLKIHSFNSFFYPKLEKTGFSGVKRWTKKVDIFSMDLVILPVHLGMHWCLAAIDMRKKQIAYYDSLKGNNGKCIASLRKYLQEEHKDKKKAPLDMSSWTEVMPKDIPEQLNGCDCGVFACKYAEYLTRDAKFNFGQEHMPYFRKRMIYEILSKKLL